MSDPYASNLIRECAAFAVGLVLSATLMPVLAGHLVNPFTVDYAVGVVAMVAVTGFFTMPLFLVNVLFVWPYFHDRLSTLRLICLELILVLFGVSASGLILHRGISIKANWGVEVYAFTLYALYRATSLWFEWLGARSNVASLHNQ